MGMAEWGYSVLEGSPSEQFTTSGAEASVKYIGPSLYRVPFIKEVFGAWHISSSQVEVQDGDNTTTETLRCAAMSPQPTAYPYMTVLNEEAQCTGEVCLWPDTFSGQPSGDSKPYLLNCGAGSDLGYPILDQCAWEYTVNYRYKNNGALPDILNPSTTLNPSVPFGTYTACRISTSGEFMTTPGRYWTYEPNLFNTAGSPSWSFDQCCVGKTQLLKVEDDGVAGQLIRKVDVEVIWENVPLPPWDVIRAASGCVNSHPIFGFPSGSVLFEFGEPEITGYFGCMEVYRMRYVFKVKTVPIRRWAGSSSGEVIDGQLGIWNRRYCPCQVRNEADQCTHWVPIKSAISGAGEQSCLCPEGDSTLFGRYPLQMLFAMNTCACDPTDASPCVNTFGYATIPDPNDSSATPAVWIVPGLSQETFNNLPALAGMSFTAYEPAV